MEIIIKEYKTYKYEELSKEAKEKIIENHYENEYLYGYDFLEEDIKEEFLNMKTCFKDISLQYSLSHCQGDGLSFSGELDLKKFINEKYSKKLRSSYKWAINEYIYSVISKGNGGNYCYASEYDIEYTENYQDYKNHDQINKLFAGVLKEIQEYYLEICDKLEKYGFEILDYRMNDQEMQVYCEANSYTFLENGEMF